MSFGFFFLFNLYDFYFYLTVLISCLSFSLSVFFSDMIIPSLHGGLVLQFLFMLYFNSKLGFSFQAVPLPELRILLPTRLNISLDRNPNFYHFDIVLDYLYLRINLIMESFAMIRI